VRAIFTALFDTSIKIRGILTFNFDITERGKTSYGIPDICLSYLKKLSRAWVFP